MDSAELFRTSVKAISENYAMESALEIEANLAERSNPKRFAVLSAALCFCHGFDFTAVGLLVDAGIKGADRMVAKLRIEVADAPHYWNLPGRNAA